MSVTYMGGNSPDALMSWSLKGRLKTNIVRRQRRHVMERAALVGVTTRMYGRALATAIIAQADVNSPPNCSVARARKTQSSTASDGMGHFARFLPQLYRSGVSDN